MPFITVKYGDREEALFNPHCRTLHLLEDLKRRCNCPDHVTVDLSDMRGFVKNLSDHQSSNASDFLNERETFILVQVDKTSTEGRDFPLYTPLLNDEDVLTTEFLESLRRTPTDSLEVSGRNSRTARRGSLKPSAKTKLSGNLSPTGSNLPGSKFASGRRRSSINRLPKTYH